MYLFSHGTLVLPQAAEPKHTSLLTEGAGRLNETIPMRKEHWRLEHLPRRLKEEKWFLPSGTLILGGGGGSGEFEKAIKDHVDVESPVVLVPTALSTATDDIRTPAVRRLREQSGFTDLKVLHTWDRRTADSEDFVKPLKHAKCVIFGGGETYRLFETYVGTRFQQELEGVLARGGVIAGVSAGAMLFGSVVIDQPYMRFIGYEAGFGFLPETVIDVHVLARNNHYELTEARAQDPGLLGIGLDEGAVVVVEEDWMTVAGNSYVVVHDSDLSGPNPGRFYFMRKSDIYHLKHRRPERRYWSSEPFASARGID